MFGERGAAVARAFPPRRLLSRRAWASPPRRRRAFAAAPSSQLRYWSRSGLVEPPATADGGYTFRDLVALRVVRSLLDAGLPSARVRVALDAVRDAGHDLASLRLDHRRPTRLGLPRRRADPRRAPRRSARACSSRSTRSPPTSTPTCGRSRREPSRRLRRRAHAPRRLRRDRRRTARDVGARRGRDATGPPPVARRGTLTRRRGGDRVDLDHASSASASVGASGEYIAGGVQPREVHQRRTGRARAERGRLAERELERRRRRTRVRYRRLRAVRVPPSTRRADAGAGRRDRAGAVWSGATPPNCERAERGDDAPSATTTATTSDHCDHVRAAPVASAEPLRRAAPDRAPAIVVGVVERGRRRRVARRRSRGGGRRGRLVVGAARRRARSPGRGGPASARSGTSRPSDRARPRARRARPSPRRATGRRTSVPGW